MPFDGYLEKVPLPANYKKWMCGKHNEPGLCYLLLFRRKYRYLAFYRYGRYPLLKDLLLDPCYWSKAFDTLNVCVNYPQALIHVYRTSKAIYPHRFEHLKGNSQLTQGGFNQLFVIGATLTTTQVNTQTDSPLELRRTTFNDIPDDSQTQVPITGHLTMTC